MSFNKRVKHDFTPTLLEGREPLEARGYKHSSESFGKDLWFEMSDSGEPHRLEELESKVENMVDMISQLLEAKSAGGGQQREEKESGGTRRGADHNYNGGAGRASPTADTGYGATAVRATAAAEVPVYIRRAASEPTRSADGTGRRPEAPAGVGLTVIMYSGEARESHLAGIAEHDGGNGVFKSSFHGQPHVNPPVLKRGKGLPKLQARFSSESKQLGHF